MDFLKWKLGRRQFISASSAALGAGMLAKTSRLLSASEGAQMAPAVGEAPTGAGMDMGGPPIVLKDDGKYGKYIILPPEKLVDSRLGLHIFGSGVRGLIEDCNVSPNFVRWGPPGPYPAHAQPLRSDNVRHVFSFLGNHPEDPMDLGAEEEFWLGMGKNLERYPTLKNSAFVYVPAGMRRWPWLTKVVHRTITWVQWDITIPGMPIASQTATRAAPPTASATKVRDMFIPTAEEIANETWPNLTEEQKANARKSAYIYSNLVRSGVGADMARPKGGQWIAYLDADIVAEAPLLRYIRYRPEAAPYPIINSQTHEYGTFFFFHGIDIDDPRYLGAEIELYIGPENEKHTINTTALVWVPAHTVHGPFAVKKAQKPFLFVECVAGPEHPGTVYDNVLPT